MKKILIALVAAILVLSGCANMFRDELAELHGEIDSIKEQIKGMNTSLNDIQTIVNALQGNIYVKSIVPVMKNGEEVGYTITFTDNTVVTVYKGGSGGTDLGVKQDTDGYWYWTLNGEWLLNSEGKKVNASGVAGKTPQLKIEGGYWYVSTDDGKTWTKLGQATGDSMFKEIDTSNSAFVVLTLADGSKLTIPRYKPITISYSAESQRIGISANETISIDYSLSEGDDETIIAVATDGQYSATVKKKDNTHGVINITCPLQFAEGTVNVLVYDGKGYMTMSVLEFYEKDMSFSAGTQFSLDVDGGKLEIPYTTNFNFRFTTDEGTSWITVKDEKASETQGKIVVSVSKNSGNARTGHIYIYPTFGSDKAFATITINQASAYYKIDYSTFLADSKGGQFVSTITTSRGVKIGIPSNINWVTYSMSNSGNEYRVTFTVEANSMTSRRDVEIGVYATDGTGEKLGTIQIGQLPASADASKMMVFEVRANVANEYDVYIPLYGELDCYIDWGDGTTDYYGEWSETVHHKYGASSATDYEVKVSGTVKQLSSRSIPDNKRYGIISIKQWGNTGLISMENAFAGLWSLQQIPSDNAESFSNVTSFSYAFYQCDALRAIPEDLLKYAKRVEDLSYAFSNCTAIQSIPEKLLYGCTSARNIDYLFSECVEIKSIPEALFSSLSEIMSAKGLFYGCSSITTVPERLFSSFAKVTTYRELFRGCTSLKSVPGKLFSFSPLVTDFGFVFFKCLSLQTIPKDIFAKNTYVETFEFVFSAAGLVDVPAEIFANCPYVTSFYAAFGAPYIASFAYDNYTLKTIPVSIFDNNRLVSNFDCCFSDLKSVEGESPYTIINGEKVHLYERYKYPDIFVRPRYYGSCFHNCNYADRVNAPDWYDW